MSRIALPQTNNQLLDRCFSTIQQAVNDLDSRVPNGVLTESAVYVLTDYQITDDPVVIARISGIKVQLPRANNLGTAVAEFVVVWNQSGGNITLLAQGTDKVNLAASITLTTGQAAWCTSDGDALWKAWVA